MKAIGYYNGHIDDLDRLTVPALDRAVYFGDGVYDVAYAVGGVPFALDDHFDRFESSCRAIDITPPLDRDAMRGVINELINRLASDCDTLVYWQASRGTADRAHNYPLGVPANLFAYVKPKKLPDMFRRIKLLTADDLRYDLCNVKTLNLIPNVMANQKAVAAGCDEAVLVRGGVVTECSHSSLHMLRDGHFISHPLDCRILPGIARKHCIELCAELGIPVEEREFSLDELMNADEVLVTSTTTICRSASEIDGKAVGGRDGTTLRRLQDAYIARIEKETGKSLV